MRYTKVAYAVHERLLNWPRSPTFSIQYPEMRICTTLNADNRRQQHAEVSHHATSSTVFAKNTDFPFVSSVNCTEIDTMRVVVFHGISRFSQKPLHSTNESCGTKHTYTRAAWRRIRSTYIADIRYLLPYLQGFSADNAWYCLAGEQPRSITSVSAREQKIEAFLGWVEISTLSSVSENTNKCSTDVQDIQGKRFSQVTFKAWYEKRKRESLQHRFYNKC